MAMPNRNGGVRRSSRQAVEVPRVLVIDSYDSFVYNLVQYLGELGADPIVHRNDAITVDEALAEALTGADAAPTASYAAVRGASRKTTHASREVRN